MYEICRQSIVLHVRHELRDGNDVVFFGGAVRLEVAQRCNQFSVGLAVDRINFPRNTRRIQQLKNCLGG